MSAQVSGCATSHGARCHTLRPLFLSVPGPTWTNRFFALSGTSSGRVEMPGGIKDPRLGEFFRQDQTTLFDQLNDKDVSWKVYFYDFPSSLILNHQRRI